jgi:hypothetical protein
MAERLPYFHGGPARFHARKSPVLLQVLLTKTPSGDEILPSKKAPALSANGAT